MRIVFSFALTCAVATAHAAEFIPLGDLPGGDFYSSALGLSDDGSVVVGTSATSDGRHEAFHWTREDGMTSLGFPGEHSLANDVSADGAVVVGGSGPRRDPRAYRWSEATGLVELPIYPEATAVSADGSVVVGGAFRWSSGGGAVRLAGTGPEGPNTYDISADGTTIVGNSGCFGFLCSRPALWTETDGLVVLAESGWATGVSADGSVVVGRVTIAGPYFRWTESEGLVELDLAVGNFTRANGGMHVSANGRIAVGGLYDADAGLSEAIIWDSMNGARSIRQILIQAGVDLTGWRLDYSTAVSGDGGTIIGSGVNPDGNAEAWLARLSIGQPGDTNFDGLVNIDDLNAVRNHFGLGDGTNLSGIPGDTFPFDGYVNIDDLNAVRNNFGAGGNIAVPEPGAGLLALLGVLLVAAGRRRCEADHFAPTNADFLASATMVS